MPPPLQSLGLSAPSLRPFGAQANGLTRFGNTWVNLSQIDGVNFDPPDGCSIEIDLRSGNCIHLGAEDAQCFQSYLEGLDSVQRTVDNAAREHVLAGV